MAKVERDLLSRIKDEERAALGYHTGELGEERTQALEYYMQFPLGNEVEGESSVIDSSVRDTVDWMLPSLIRIFAASGRIVEFEPVGAEDVEAADQASDAVNHVFWKQNNGLLILYEWFKDALIQKNGVVKWYYEDREQKKTEKYEGLTEEGLALLVADDNVEVTAHTAYPIEAQMPVGIESPMLHDVEVEITTQMGKVCIEVIAPEEFLISPRHNSISLKECEFCEHRVRKTKSDLKEMGYDPSDIEEIGADEDSFAEISSEYLARRLYTEEQFPEDERKGPSSPIWLREVYIRHDYDDDGVAELRRVMVAGNKILENEETDSIPFAAITPNILPHRFVGMSIAQEVMDLQQIKTTLWRETLNNLYLTNRPRKAVLANRAGMVEADLEDLLTSRVGGVVREYQPNAVREMVTPFMAQHSYGMMEYIDQQRFNRTGEMYLGSGLDADSINKTARGAQMAENTRAEKKEMIARLFAETGVKELMKGILYTLNKYSMREMMIRMHGTFVPVDPRNWNTQWDMSVNVGLGTGNKDQQLGHIMNIAGMQKEMLAAGKTNMVTDPNIYASAKKITENAGYKHVEEFFTDPKSVPPPQPPMNPDMIKAQAQAQLEQFKAQQEQLKTQADSELEIAKTRMTQQGAIQVANIHSVTQVEIEKMRIASQERMEAKKIAAEAEFKVFDAENEATLKTAEMEDKKEERSEKYADSKEERSRKYDDRIKQMEQDEVDREQLKSVDSAVKAVEKASQAAAKELGQQMSKITKDMDKRLETLSEEVKKKPKKASIKAPSGQMYEVDID